MSAAAPKVELLWWQGCPSTPEALADLRAILEEEGLDPDSVEVVEVATDADAEAERFVGSPTIRVDGEDVVPAGDEQPIGLSCRVYPLRNGRISPTPDPEQVREVVRRAGGKRS